jgi:deoxyribodipyrimidine photo-lyase
MIEARTRKLNSFPGKPGKIVYWMSREQRANDNWALLFAQKLAHENKNNLTVIFTLVPEFLGATIRPYKFMLEGLSQVSKLLREKGIPFIVLFGEPVKEVSKFLLQNQIAYLVTDFDPLRIKREWKRRLIDEIDIPMYEADGHNIVPCWVASDKQEFGAYTIRPKIKRLLTSHLTEIPTVEKQQIKKSDIEEVDFNKLLKTVNAGKEVFELNWIKNGESSAYKMLGNFISNKLENYPANSNNPTFDGLSNLSPYIHFGVISCQRIALEVLKSKTSLLAKEKFLEQLVIRRELADNFCYHNTDYDSIKGIPKWGKTTLMQHARDKREYSYTLKEFEEAKTHDNLWNACQIQMVKTGKMHSYMRMYWAKKILEWTEDPNTAVGIAISLNDRYSLDGRDPNGYTGILWSVGGLHDRPWMERAIYGKVRYMSYNGCKNKFDVDKYIEMNLK